jgi:DNA-binding transcriptional ArsR family regulator
MESEAASKLLKALEAVVERLDKIYVKLSEIAEGQRKVMEAVGGRASPEELKALDALALLKLPDHLRKTALAIDRLGEGTADEVASVTGRERAVESGYLNQLVRMGYVRKRRDGRRVVFTVG